MGILVNVCAGADDKILPQSHIEALLLNVPNHGSSESKIEKAKELVQLARPRYLINDSGGFQLLDAERISKTISFDPNLPVKFTSRELNITPKHVMEGASPFQPDIVVGLDWPIKKIKVKCQTAREEEFFKKLDFNVKWAFESAFWWKQLCPQYTKFFLPIQCYNIAQLDVFLSSIAGLEYDGVSMPIRNLELWEIALFLVKFYQLGIKRVHLLGTSSFFTIALCAYVSQHMFDWVSLDAKSWFDAAKHSESFSQYDLSREKFGPSVTISQDIVNNCPCPFCGGISFKDIQGLQYKDKFSLLRNHNWWILNKTFDDLYRNSSDVIQLERFLKSRSKNPAMVDELCKILSLVDALKDVDISLLQDLLDTSKKRKPSSSRLKTVTV